MPNSRVTRGVEPPRPLVAVALCFVVGVVAGWRVELPLWWAVAILALVSAGYMILRSRWLLYGLVAMCGVLVVSAEGAVEEELPSQGVYSLEVRTHNRAVVRGFGDVAGGEWRGGGREIIFGADSTLAIQIGDRLLCHGRLQHFGRRGYIYISERSIMEHHSSTTTGISGWGAGRIERLKLNEESSAMANAMLLGRKGGLSKEVRESYRRSGLAHLLALSGLHLGIISLILGALLRPLVLIHRGNVWRVVILVSLIWVYVYAVGAPTSVVRAAIMFSAMWLASISLRRYNSINTLAAAVIVMVAWDPEVIFDLGFQLSVLSVGSIILWALPLWHRISGGEGRGYIWRLIAEVTILPIIIGAGCTLATMPILAHTFGEVPLFGVILNPILYFTVVGILAGGVIWTLLGLGILAPLFGWFIELCVTIQNGVTTWGGSGWRGVVGVEIDGG